MRHRRRVTFVTIVAAGAIATAAGAASLGVVSSKLGIFSQSLSTGTCAAGTPTVSDDTYTDQALTGDNSAATTLSISPRSTKLKYAWVKFTLAPCSIPANAQVDSATLTVNVTTASTGRTLTITRATSAWTAAGLTSFTNNPSVAGAATGTANAASAGAKTIDVTDDVVDWVDGAAANNGWRIADLGATANITVAIGASENLTAGNRPTLSLNYSY